MLVLTHQHQRIHHIVDVEEIPLLLAIAEYADFLSGQTLAYEPVKKALSVVVHLMAGTIDVGEAQGGVSHFEQVVKEPVVFLYRRLVHAVYVDRFQRMILIHRHIDGTAVLATRAGVNYPRLRAQFAQSVQKP